MRASTGEYVLLLNSDTYLGDECLTKSMAYMEEHPEIGALGCKVVLPDGTLDHACKRGFPTPQASLYYFLKLHKLNKEKYGLYDALHLHEDEVGMLDEDLFMYGEDIDLCYRIKQGGYRIIYYPKAMIIHYKHVYNVAVTGVVWTGIWSKYALEIGKNALKSTGQTPMPQTQEVQQNN